MLERDGPVVLATGATASTAPAGLLDLRRDGVDLRFATDVDALRVELPNAEVILAWDNGSPALAALWPFAARLRWIQGAGAGIDRLLFPAVVDSDVALTNAHGKFDRSTAEFTLAVILAFAKDLRRTIELQRDHVW